MPDRDTVVNRIETICEICKTNRWQTVFDSDTIYPLLTDALALLKEQENEEERILKIVWDVLHGCVSTDTKEDQDYVYELIRNKVRPMY